VIAELNGNPLLDYYNRFDGRRYGSGLGRYADNRNAAVEQWAWAVPSSEAIDAIAKLQKPVIEIGAGRGYWAAMLEQAGVDIVAFDINPPTGHKVNMSHVEPGLFFNVQEGTHEAVLQHQDRALMLCWPYYDLPAAYDSIEAYEGDTVIYVGEPKVGSSGCTGCEKFHESLRRDWEFVESVSIPRWDSIRDGLDIYRRKEKEND